MVRSKQNLNDETPTVSKSQRRRAALELKSLASELIRMGPAKLARLPIDENIRRAIEEACTIHSNVARKRQLQYIAKLLRREDPTPIIESIAGLRNEALRLTARQHRTEAWRDYLLETGDAGLGALIQPRREADAQAIRQLIRNARTEASHDKPPAASRALFRLLRKMDETEALPPCPHRRKPRIHRQR